MTSEITHNEFYKLTKKLSSAQSLDEIHKQCTKFSKLTGFDYFSYCVAIPTTLTRPDMIEISSYPEAWLTLYKEQELIKTDPTLAYAETHHTPALWGEIESKRLNKKATSDFINRAKKYGLNNGISFPLHGNVGSAAVYNLASEKTASLPRGVINTALTFGALFANYVHDAVLRIFDEDLLPLKKKRLSQREKECLLWVAEGKTAWEIAKILKIANRTVTYHLEQTISKLNVKNRQQAVAQGMMMSYISHRLDCEPPLHTNKTTRNRQAC